MSCTTSTSTPPGASWAGCSPCGADKALTRLVFAALDGLVLHQLVLGEPDVTDAALEELRSLLRLLDANGDGPQDGGVGEARA